MSNDDNTTVRTFERPRRLVLLANAYPFGTWEPYLKPELARLAQLFDVSLYALSVRKEQSSTRRAVPVNVTVTPLPLHSLFFYAIVSLRGLFSALFLKELLRAFRATNRVSSSVVYTAKIWARAQWESRQIKRDLLKQGFNADSSFVLYSYRMEYQAYICYVLKQYFRNAQVVIRGHGSDLEVDHRPARYVPFRELSFSIAERLVVISRYNLQYLEQRYSQFSNRMLVSYLGIDDCGQQIWNSSSQLRLVSVSYLGAAKRVDVMAEALQRFAELHLEVNIVWQHFGDGDDLEQYRLKTKQLGPNVEAHFVGHVDHDQLLEQLRHAQTDLFLSTSAREGLPVSMMEAMCLGIPVASTPVAGVPEIVKSGFNGWLLDESDIVASLVDVLWQYCGSDDHQKVAMRQRARKTWEQSFSAQAAFASFTQMLLKMLPGDSQ